jgi:hypothetical protein
MQRELARLDALFLTAFLDQSLGYSSAVSRIATIQPVT